MRYKGINLRDLADKIPATDAKDGFGRLQAQPDMAPKAPDHKSTRGVENVFLAAAHGDKAVAMSLLNSLQRRMGKSNTETTEATISDRLAAFLRLLGDDPTSEAGTLRRQSWRLSVVLRTWKLISGVAPRLAPRAKPMRP